MEIEPEGAAIVQRIFDMAAAGMSAPQITRKLNQEHILTPSQIKNRMGQLHKWWVGIGDRKVWDSRVVLDILRDERYLGKNIYGRKSRVGVGDSHIKQNDREDWVIVEDCHEAVVSKEKFAAAQRNVCGYIKKRKQESVKHLFSGKLRCVVCGYLLHCIKRPVLHYRCMTWRKVERVSCAKGDLKESELAETVLATIHLYVKTLLDKRDVRQKAKEGGRIPVLIRQLDMLKANIQGFQERKAILYDRLAEWEIDRREFQNNQDVISHQQEEVQKQYDKLKKEVSQLVCLTDGERIQERELGDYLGMKELTREMVEAFVECIYVYGDKTLHIQWKFEEVVGKK